MFSGCTHRRAVKLQTNEDTIIPEFPMKCLHTDSFASLTRLDLNITNTRDWGPTPLDDPYMGFCQASLGNFTALRELNLQVWIIDVVELPETAYGSQWQFQDQALVIDGLSVSRIPTLDSVCMQVFLKVWESSKLAGGGPDDAEESLANINALVYPRHFPGLVKLTKAGALAFSFQASITTVPHNAPGHYHYTPQWQRHHAWQ